MATIELKNALIGDLGILSGTVTYSTGLPASREEPEELPEIEGCTLVDVVGNPILEDVIFDDESLYDALLEVICNEFVPAPCLEQAWIDEQKETPQLFSVLYCFSFYEKREHLGTFVKLADAQATAIAHQPEHAQKDGREWYRWNRDSEMEDGVTTVAAYRSETTEAMCETLGERASDLNNEILYIECRYPTTR